MTIQDKSTENKVLNKANAPKFNLEVFEKSVLNVLPKNESKERFESLRKKCLIDLNEVLSPPPVAIKILSNNEIIPLFTKGNFSIITGKAKSRKTGLVHMILASAIAGAYNDFFFCDNKGLNILFDSEQSKYKVQQNAQKIAKMSDTLNDFEVYSLRVLEPCERLDLIEEILKDTFNSGQKLNIVAIDGIVDLAIDPIMQVEQAQNIVSKLMQWSENYDCHIVCVLHLNKGVNDTLLGHIGSFSHRKADSVIKVEKDSDNKDISIVTAYDCREKEFEPFAFTISDENLPIIYSDFKQTTQKTKSKKPTPQNTAKEYHTIILERVFKKEPKLTYAPLVAKIKEHCINVLGTQIGTNIAGNFLTYYVESDMIYKDDKVKPTLYTLPI